jgi:hypothetical protein
MRDVTAREARRLHINGAAGDDVVCPHCEDDYLPDLVVSKLDDPDPVSEGVVTRNIISTRDEGSFFSFRNITPVFADALHLTGASSSQTVFACLPRGSDFVRLPAATGDEPPVASGPGFMWLDEELMPMLRRP